MLLPLVLVVLSLLVLPSQSIDPSAYRQRETGRTGNCLYEEMFWRLKTARHGVSFTKIARDLPWPFSDLKPYVTSEENKRIPYNFSLWTDEVPNYPLSFKFYRDNREAIMHQLPGPRTPCRDVVVHMRLEDVFGYHPDYTALPIEWYAGVFDEIFGEGGGGGKTVCIIGKPVTTLQQRMMRRVRSLLVERYVDEINVFVYDANSVDRDVQLMYGSRIFVGSTSTLWFWPVWTSPQLEAAYVPGFFLTQRDMQFGTYDHPLIRLRPTGLEKKMNESQVEENYSSPTEMPPRKVHPHPPPEPETRLLAVLRRAGLAD